MYRLAYERMGAPRGIAVFGAGKSLIASRAGCCQRYLMVSPAVLFIIRTDERVVDRPVPVVCSGHRAESVSTVSIRANDSRFHDG